MQNPLEPHELSAIALLAAYFNTSITILAPISSYKRTTPDIIINGQRWEIKSPTTAKLSTFENRFKDASHQSKYIVMDLRRLQIDEDKTLRYLERLIRLHRRVQRVLIVKKDGSIVSLKKSWYNKKRRGRAVPNGAVKGALQKLLRRQLASLFY